MSKEYVNYHKHCHYSNLAGTADSTVKPIDYINRAKELGHTVVSCVQHSSPFGYFEYYDLCKQNNLKFLFGVEAYFTELDNKEDKQNSHLCILAKKAKAFQSINALTSRANKENFYYKPRVALDWILELDEDEVIITSACVAGFWKRENYEEIALKLHSKFKNNFYLELQYHATPSQIDINSKIMSMHEKYGINIIVGCDSHMISESQKVDRDAFLYAKGINYEDEEGWHLDYPSYDEIIERFKTQGIVPIKKVEEALNNTLVLKEVEDIYISKDIKLPSIYKDKTQEEKNNILFNIIKDELVNKFGDMKDVPKKYQEAVLSELKVVKETNMADYFILNYHIIKRGKELGGHMTATGRGCFIPETKVLTMNGYKNIKDVKIGDIVINSKKQFDTVIDKLKYDIEEDITTIKSIGNKEISLTNDHKIYIYDLSDNSYKYVEAKKINKEIHYLTTPILETAEKNIIDEYDTMQYDINNFYDDHFCYEKFKGSNNLSGIDGAEFLYSPVIIEKKIGICVKTLYDYRKNKIKKNSARYEKIYNCLNMNPEEYDFYVENKCNTIKTNRYIKNDYSFMFFLGFFLGDGNINYNSSKKRITLYLGTDSKKDSVAKPILEKFLNDNSIRYIVRKEKDKKMERIEIYSNSLQSLLVEHFKVYKDGEKYIDIQNIINSNSIDNLNGLFDGLIYSDGSFEKSKDCINTRVCFDNKSEYLIALFNVLSFICKQTPTNRITDKRYNVVKTRLIRKSFFVDKKNGYICSKVYEVKDYAGYKGEVYDLTVKNDPSFMVENAIVHNSAPSWYINSLLGFSTIDRLDCPITLYPERFLTTDRVLSGNLPDIDYNLADRNYFIQAQREILGEDNSYWFCSYGKLKTKSAWKMYAKANNVPFEISNTITKYIDEYETALKYAEDDEKDNILPEQFIPSEYIEIFNGSKKYFGIIDNVSPSPCSFLLLDTPISLNVGVIKIGDEFCANIEGGYADKYMFVKNDLLAVTVVDIIAKTFIKIGIPQIDTNTLRKITMNDSRTWDIYKNGYTMCLNQVEQPKTREKTIKYSPRNISELSALIAGVRPSFQSMINILINRENFSYGIEAFDNLIQTEEMPQSFILYQEMTMKVLEFAGFPIQETYQLIKAISKKKTGIIEPIRERFINGFSKNAKCDMESTLKVWQIVEDSVGYGFNSSHSYSVSLDSLYGAYLKAYYPLEFYTTCIEIYTAKKNKKKLSAIKEEMRAFGIREGELKFGENNSIITFDKNRNIITQLLGSIKDINEKCAVLLYELSKSKKYHNFLDLLVDINTNKILQSNQLTILIKLDYFSEFGKAKYLLSIVDIYNNIAGRKQIKKDQLSKFGLSEEMIDRHAKSSTAKMYKDFDDIAIIKELIDDLENLDISLKDKIATQLEYLGYVQYTNEDISDKMFYVLETKFYGNKKDKPYLKLLQIKNGKNFDMKITTGFELNSFAEGDIIKIEKAKKVVKKKKGQDGKYYTVPNEFNIEIERWGVL